MRSLSGIRLGMTPRRVAAEAAQYGWRIDSFSTQTLEDLTRVPSGTIGFDVQAPKVGRLTISFCRYQASYLSFEEDYSSDAEAHVVEKARQRLVELGEIREKREDLALTLLVAPTNQTYAAFVAYRLVAGQSKCVAQEKLVDSSICAP